MGIGKKHTTSEKPTHIEELSNVAWYLTNGEYENAKKILFKIISQGKSENINHRIFYMLGIAYFGTNELSAAKRTFMSVLEYNSTHILSKLYLSVIFVLIDDKIKALEYLLGAKSDVKFMTRGKNSKYIRNAMNYIKNNAGNDDKILDIFSKAYDYQILPRFGKSKQRRIIKNILIFLVISVLVSGIWFLVDFNNIIFKKTNNERTKIITKINETLEAEKLQQSDDNLVFVTLTKRKYNQLLSNMEKDFIQYKDNRVWVQANTILYSNVSQQEKNKVLLITQNLSRVDYSSDITLYDFEEVHREPWKFNNVVIRWKGTITRITPLETGETRAQFLVNFYGDSKELLATLNTLLPQSIVLENGSEVELLAKIIVEPVSLSQKDFELSVLSFRYLLE